MLRGIIIDRGVARCTRKEFCQAARGEPALIIDGGVVGSCRSTGKKRLSRDSCKNIATIVRDAGISRGRTPAENRLAEVSRTGRVYNRGVMCAGGAQKFGDACGVKPGCARSFV